DITWDPIKAYDACPMWDVVKEQVTLDPTYHAQAVAGKAVLQDLVDLLNPEDDVEGMADVSHVSDPLRCDVYHGFGLPTGVSPDDYDTVEGIHDTMKSLESHLNPSITATVTMPLFVEWLGVINDTLRQTPQARLVHYSGHDTMVRLIRSALGLDADADSDLGYSTVQPHYAAFISLELYHTPGVGYEVAFEYYRDPEGDAQDLCPLLSTSDGLWGGASPCPLSVVVDALGQSISHTGVTVADVMDNGYTADSPEVRALFDSMCEVHDSQSLWVWISVGMLIVCAGALTYYLIRRHQKK
ncbi:histidine phosphatase superfamily protein, partial [Kipferlia bialata]